MRGAPKARDDEFTQERKKAHSNLLALGWPQIMRNLSANSDRRQTVIVGMRTVELTRSSGRVPVLNK